MLQKQTVEPRTFSLLRELMLLPELMSFNLVGGTTLALKYGHRKSIDLDLFSSEEFDKSKIENILRTHFAERFFYENTFARWGIFCYIDNIKVDLVYYPHPLIDNMFTIDGIRFIGEKDLIAMKIQAILGRGKKKDFWDIAELLNHYSIQDFIDFHKQKYFKQILGISVPQALIYFTDADESEEPEALKIKSWNEVKKFISKKVRDFLI